MSYNIGGYISDFAKGYSEYEDIKGRKNPVIKFPPCGKMTYRFVKGGALDGPGGRSGMCGTQKDNKRVYCC